MRVAAALLLEPVARVIADDAIYLEQARRWVETGTLDTGAWVRPPLYFAFLALTSLVPTGPLSWPLFSKLLQCLAGAATAIPVYGMAHRVAGRTAARIAAAFLLFDPTLIAYSVMLWPETLFTLATTLVFWKTAELAPGQIARPLALGVLTGLAMLLKPVFGAFTLILAASWLLRFGLVPALRLAVPFAVATALVLSPWVIRNQQLYGGAILLENQGAYNLWVAGHTGEPYEVWKSWQEIGDPIVQNQVGTAKGIEGISARPIAFAGESFIRALNLWGLEYFVVRNLTVESWGQIGRGAFFFWFWLLQVAYAALLLSAALGVGTLWRDPHLRALVLWAAVYTVIVALLVGTTRFRLPLHGLLAVSAGVGWALARMGRVARRDLIAVACAIALLLLSTTRPLFQTIVLGRFETVADLRHSDWLYFRY